MRRTVRFADAVRALVERGDTTFIGVGPHPVLCSSVVETADAIGVEATATGSLRRDDGGPRRFLTGVGQAWAWGVPVAWGARHTPEQRRRRVLDLVSRHTAAVLGHSWTTRCSP
ncbi:hypothetical protein DEH69_12690 [Streptomyces sp. PT12]|nr:hypothetical protein DEH69_12690 [Streptomyces sp. PT12]